MAALVLLQVSAHTDLPVSLHLRTRHTLSFSLPINRCIWRSGLRSPLYESMYQSAAVRISSERHPFVSGSASLVASLYLSALRGCASFSSDSVRSREGRQRMNAKRRKRPLQGSGGVEEER